MEQDVYIKHRQLADFPPAQLVYILYRRLVEQGLQVTWLWLSDKITRRIRGVSPPKISEVQPGLYVGGQHSRKALGQMSAWGIEAVVNMREETDDAARGVALAHYLWLPTTDDEPPLLEDLTRGAAFITQQRDAGHGVYIHCAAGVGRAPTMAAAYLVAHGMPPDRAWETIRNTRPFIRPTPPQFDIIRAFASHSKSQGTPT